MKSSSYLERWERSKVGGLMSAWRVFPSVFVSWLLLPVHAWAQTEPASPTPALPPPPPLPPPPSTAGTALLPRDLSVWGMVLQADWLVQAVMVGLAVASVITWTVFVAKSIELAAATRRQRR